MKKSKALEISYTELDSREDLTTEELSLLELAEKARNKAYSPYSGFSVGASVLLENGEIFTGSNQENSSFPAGICAERTAIFAARANYPDVVIKTVCITAKGSEYIKENPVTPCGICRQVFSEYEHLQKKPFKIILASENGKLLTYDKAEYLLPFSFYSTHLND